MRSHWFWPSVAGALPALLGALLLTLAGCGAAPAEAPAAARPPLYFDVKGLLDQQVRQLLARAAAVTKRVSLRGGTVETVRVPTVRWPDELQIFYQADINKAALRGAYAVDSARLPGGELRRTYTRRPGQRNAPVARLTVLTNAGQAQEITADIDQANALFSATKQLRMSLSTGKLNTYSVRGSQKLVFFDTLRYEAEGQL